MANRGWLKRAFASAFIAKGVMLSSLAVHARELGDELAVNGVAAPPIVVHSAGSGTEPGLIFVAPKSNNPTLAHGLQIADDAGRTLWFLPNSLGGESLDFRVQSYLGEPVLTWIEVEIAAGAARTTGYVADSSYRVIASVQADNGYPTDVHEFLITPENTALILIYNRVPYDLTPYGGAADSIVVDGMIQEIDMATGEVIFEWHSVQHVGFDESYAALPTTSGGVFDYTHLNAVNLDEDGHLLLSARQTHAVYKISRQTGEVLWRMGGKQSDFGMGPGASFEWQHDAHAVGDSTIRLFDNHASAGRDPVPSRVLWLQRSEDQTVSLVRAIQHPEGLSATSQGNAQGLPGGNTFVGWGNTGRFSEFDGDGRLVLDARVADGRHTYRAYRLPWSAQPETLPTATAQRNGDGTTTIHALWNGATAVTHWYVVGGDREFGLWPVGGAAWNGIDTTMTIGVDVAEVAVVASDARGLWLARSPVVAVAEALSVSGGSEQ